MFLGLDCSTQSLTALVVDEAGKCVFEQSVNFATEFPEFKTDHGVLHGPNGRATAPIAMFLSALDRLLASPSSLQQLIPRIEAIAVSAQQHATVYCAKSMRAALALLNSDAAAAATTTSSSSSQQQLADILSLHLTRPDAPIWMDQSTGAEIAAIRKRLAAAEFGGDETAASHYVAAVTGSDLALRFPAAQIAKFALQEAPEKYAETDVIHLLSSFLTSVLCGQHASIDHGDGAGMNLLNVVNQQQQDNSGGILYQWDQRMLRATGAPNLQDKLPPVQPSATKAPVSLAKYFSARFGFREDVTALLGTGDNPSSLIGCGAASPGRIVISLGTSDTVFAPMPATLPQQKQLEKVSHNNSRVGHIFGNPASTGWMKLIISANGSLAREQVLRHCGFESWDSAEAAMKAQQQGEEEIQQHLRPILPFIQPEICPPHPAVDVVSQCREIETPLFPVFIKSQICHLRRQAEVAGILPGGTRPTCVLLTGGASKNDYIAQIVADIFRAPVQRLATSSSAALGAALRALQFARNVPWSDVDKMVPVQDALAVVPHGGDEAETTTEAFFTEYCALLEASLKRLGAT